MVVQVGEQPLEQPEIVFHFKYPLVRKQFGGGFEFFEDKSLVQLRRKALQIEVARTRSPTREAEHFDAVQKLPFVGSRVFSGVMEEKIFVFDQYIFG